MTAELRNAYSTIEHLRQMMELDLVRDEEVSRLRERERILTDLLREAGDWLDAEWDHEDDDVAVPMKATANRIRAALSPSPPPTEGETNG